MSLFDLNRATIIGNVTKEPQLRYTAKGTALLSFSVATNRRMQEQDGSYKDMPTYHNIVSWSKLAERVGKLITKGMKIYIEGRIENRSYEKDGQTRYISEVVADNIIVFDRQGAGKSYSAAPPAAAAYDGQEADETPKKPRAKKQVETPVEANFGDEDVNPDDIPF